MRKSGTKLLVILTAAALATSAAALIGCDGNGGNKNNAVTERSYLIGGFENSESRDIVLTNDSSKIGQENNENIPYVYTSNTYPLNTITDIGLKYNTYQKLRLKRDYTYEYNLEILVRLVSVQSNLDLLKLEATTYGTFEYQDNGSENYTVTISDPTSGYEKRYGSFITGEGNIYSWQMSTSPNYTINVADAANSEEPEFDRYIIGKTVAVEKYETERILYNSVFYADFVNDMAEYCSFDSSAAGGSDSSDPIPVVPDDGYDFEPDLRDTTVLPYSTPSDGVSFAVSVGGETKVLVKAPSSISSVKFGTTSVTQYDADGDSRIFAYPVAFAELGNAISVTAGSAQLSFKPTDYLKDIIDDAENDFNAATAKYLAANLINTCAAYGGTAAATDIDGYVFSSSGTYWSVNWGRRDSVDNLGGANAEGFEWVNPIHLTADGLKVPFLTMGADVGELTYAFAVPASYTNLSAAVSVGDDNKITIVPEKADSQPLDGKTVYTFKVRTASPLTYDDVIKVAVLNGQSQISHTSGYSVTRALIRIIDHNDDAIDKAKSLWSLGMAATAYGYRDTIQYAGTALINTDTEGRYEFSVGEYTYNISGAVIGSVNNGFGAALYIDGKIFSDDTVSGDGYTAVREGDNFTVTLDGAHINGLCTPDGTSLTVILKSDSYIDGPINVKYSHWIGWEGGGTTITENLYGTLISRCPITVTTEGDKSAKLYINGFLSADDTTVTIKDGASVEIKLQSANVWDGVKCATLNIEDGGELSVKYIGAEINSQFEYGVTNKFAVNATSELNVSGTLEAEWPGNAVTSPAINISDGATATIKRVGAEISDTSGIVTAGSPVLSGNVTIKGFDYGIYLNDTDATQTLTVSGGKLDITAVSYGINTSVIDDGVAYYLCRELYFLDGTVNVTVGDKGVAAITTANVTVDAADVNLVALHGVGIEARAVAVEWGEGNWHVRTSKLFVNTVSGDYEVGNLSVYAYDGSTALAVSELNLDGGRVFLYALNGGGVLHTQSNAIITVQNSDLIIESGVEMDHVNNIFGRGIRAESGGEVITVTNSGKLVFKNVQVAISSWESHTDLVNDGLIILDGCVVSLEQWEINSWELNITVTNNGQIRYL